MRPSSILSLPDTGTGPKKHVFDYCHGSRCCGDLDSLFSKCDREQNLLARIFILLSCFIVEHVLQYLLQYPLDFFYGVIHLLKFRKCRLLFRTPRTLHLYVSF